MEIVRKIVDGKKETTIKDFWEAPSTKVKVSMENNDHSGNSAANFLLEIDGGQVFFKENNTGGSLQIIGEWERECFVELLKQIVVELELIDEK